MIQQKTGQITQPGPPLPVTNGEVTDQAASQPQTQPQTEPQTQPQPLIRLNSTKQKVQKDEEKSDKTPTDEKKDKEAKTSDLGSSGRYLFFSIYH